MNPNHVSLFTLETERMVQGEEYTANYGDTHTQCVLVLERTQAPSKFYIKNVWPNTLFALTLAKAQRCLTKPRKTKRTLRFKHDAAFMKTFHGGFGCWSDCVHLSACLCVYSCKQVFYQSNSIKTRSVIIPFQPSHTHTQTHTHTHTRTHLLSAREEG